jgi:hypothetical protein
MEPNPNICISAFLMLDDPGGVSDMPPSEWQKWIG